MNYHAGKIAVIFPGIGYNPDKPLLYYSAKIAMSHGYEVIKIGYPKCDVNLKEASSEQIRTFVDECVKITGRALKDAGVHEDCEMLFISKSIGTAVAAAYAVSEDLKVRNVFFTPLTDMFDYVTDGCGIAFNGTKDPWADHKRVCELCSRNNIPVVTKDDANHSLETGNVRVDLDNIRDVMKTVEDYIANRI